MNIGNKVSNGMKIGKSFRKSTNFEKHTTKNPVGKLFLNNFLNTVVKTIKPLNIDSVLDVGCGEGFTLHRLIKEKIGKEFEGVEYNSLNELIRAVLTPFEKDSSYKKLNDSPTTVGTTSARDITISYSEEGMQVRIRLIITEKRNGYFYKVALFSPKELFENDNKTFDEIVKSFRFEC